MNYEIEISKDLDISYQDEGPWRSYQLEAMGNDTEQLWDNAFIYELDQDGGELACYHVMEAPKHVFEKAEPILLTYSEENKID